MKRATAGGAALVAVAATVAAAALLPRDGLPLRGGAEPQAVAGPPRAEGTVIPVGPAPGGAAEAATALAAGPADPQPQPQPMGPFAASTSAVFERARAIHAALRLAPEGCGQAGEELLGMIREVPHTHPLWGWALDRAIACTRTPGRPRAGADLLDAIATLYPDHPKVRARLGEQAYENGDAREAIRQLEAAAETTGTFEAWETLADARLALATEMQAHGNDPAAQILRLEARDAAQRALAAAPGHLQPFAMHMLARTELELASVQSAVRWADQSLLALSEIDARLQAMLAPEIYLFAGQIYFRSGQRETGLAYMDQGISMARTPRQVAELRMIRDEFLRDRG